MFSLNSKNRQKTIAALQNQKFDLLVIGGGITGAGIALDAASRGLKVVLVEKGDFASGTSSKSTKLIHGGLRYLKQFEFGLVRQVGIERTVVHKLAPFLVKPEKMMLPVFKGAEFGNLATSIGLWIYDFLANVKGSDRRKMLNKAQTIDKELLLNQENLLGCGIYAEYRTDDARLTLEIIKTAVRFGALCLNYVEAKEFQVDGNVISGATCLDNSSFCENSEPVKVEAHYTVNASGPWVDLLRGKSGPLEGKSIFLSKGIHIAVAHKRLPVRNSTYFQISDGRMIFCIPRHRVTYIGTTDTRFEGLPGEERPNLVDVKYLLEGVNAMFPSCNLTIDDVESGWAGLRPLIHEVGKSPGEISRRDELYISDKGLISIAGGKLTGYRLMAKKVTDLVVKKMNSDFGLNAKPCCTSQIELQKNLEPVELAKFRKSVLDKIIDLGLETWKAENLIELYGRNVDEILAQACEANCQGDEALLRSELKYSLEHEAVVHAIDYFDRRSGRLLFEIESVRKYSEVVLLHMKQYLNWDDERLEQERKHLQQAMTAATTFE